MTQAWGGWAEEEVPPPTDADAPADIDDPYNEIEPWELTRSEKRIYEAGFTTGHILAGNTIDELRARIEELELKAFNLNDEADRLYRAAFDHRNCSCWRGKQHSRGTHPHPEAPTSTSSV